MTGEGEVVVESGLAMFRTPHDLVCEVVADLTCELPHLVAPALPPAFRSLSAPKIICEIVK